MARERVMPAYDLQVCLLPIICRNINKEKSEEVRNAGAKSKCGRSCVWCARSGSPTSYWCPAAPLPGLPQCLSVNHR